MSDSSTAFNADVITAPPPDMLVEGRLFRGRVLSIAEWFAFKDRLLAYEAIERAEGDSPKPETVDGARLLMLEYLRAVFPPVTVRMGLRSRTIDPIDAIAAAGLRVTRTTFAHFFGHQLHALGLTAVQLPVSVLRMMTTAGTPLPDAIAKAPSDVASEPAPS
jgi:hypothetical protein